MYYLVVHAETGSQGGEICISFCTFDPWKPPLSQLASGEGSSLAPFTYLRTYIKYVHIVKPIRDLGSDRMQAELQSAWETKYVHSRSGVNAPAGTMLFG
jgi:hypothetical protein